MMAESVDVIVPMVGEAMSDIVLVRWLKELGDTVMKGEALFELDIEKAVVEIESFITGVLIEVMVGPDDTVEVHQVIARIDPT